MPLIFNIFLLSASTLPLEAVVTLSDIPTRLLLVEMDYLLAKGPPPFPYYTIVLATGIYCKEFFGLAHY